MHPENVRAVNVIDASLFNGDPSPEDLVEYEEYCHRWLARIQVLKQTHQVHNKGCMPRKGDDVPQVAVEHPDA